MNLRNTTIWTTGLAILITTILPILHLHDIVLSRYAIIHGVKPVMFLWLTGCLPLFISFFISISLKYEIPAATLFFPTTLYGIVCIWFSYLGFIASSWALCALPYIAVWSLPIMIPAWITAYFVDWRYRKKNQPTPSEP